MQWSEEEDETKRFVFLITRNNGVFGILNHKKENKIHVFVMLLGLLREIQRVDS